MIHYNPKGSNSALISCIFNDLHLTYSAEIFYTDILVGHKYPEGFLPSVGEKGLRHFGLRNRWYCQSCVANFSTVGEGQVTETVSNESRVIIIITRGWEIPAGGLSAHCR